jgi:predicted AlkP superfamily phosphohydrolase/phosphomutase
MSDSPENIEIDFGSGAKTFVLGLDGGTFRILQPLVDKGIMPNLAGIIARGAGRILKSTVPPVTGPAWTTFMTGVNPGEHGIFDFVRRAPEGMKRQIVGHGNISSATLFQIIGQAGLKVGAMNVPLTYPPPHVNGFIVSGMLTPGPESEFTYPASLKERLNDAADPYMLDVWWKRYSEGRVGDFIGALIECLEHRTRAIKFLIENEQWDFLAGVLTETDRIQHSLWSYINPDGDPTLEGRAGYREGHELALEFYSVLDRSIGEITAALAPETNLLIISDHGFGPMRRKFYINSWLAEQGFLKVDRARWNSLSRRKSLLRAARKIVAALRLGKIARKAKGLIKENELRRMAPYDVLDCFDWSETACYAASYSEQGIYMNLKGREPFGIVEPGAQYEELREKIIERLKNIKDPSTGRTLGVEIMKKEDIYSGPHLDDAPDIIFSIEGGAYLADIGLEKEIFMESNWQTGSGTHRPDGIFIAAGPDIKHCEGLPDADIIDLAPTILRLLRLPIPSNMEGRPLDDVLVEELARIPASYCEPQVRPEDGKPGAYSDEDEERVREKLSGLGYMG